MMRIIKKNWVILVILFAALLIRLVGIKPGFPTIHPDEEAATYGTALEMVFNGDLNPRRVDYPAGVPLIHYFLYRIFFIPVSLIRVFISQPAQLFKIKDFRELIFGAHNVNAYYWSRYISALFGAGAVWLTYLVGKRMFGKKAGLLAAFLVAFNYRHALSSHLALTDIYNSFFTLLSFYATLLLGEKDSRRRYLLAGLCCGLCFSVKYQFFHFFPFILVHIYWALKRKNLKLIWRKELLGAIIICIAVFIIINPYFFVNINKTIEVIKWVGMRYGMGKKQFLFYPLFFLYHWGISPLISLMVLFGVSIGLFLYPFYSFLLLSFIIPLFTTLIWYSSGGVYARNFTPVIPFLLSFTALGLVKIWDIFNRFVHSPKINSAIFLLLILFLNYLPVRNSVMMSLYYSRPWNSERLEKWILNFLPGKINLRSYPTYISGDVQAYLKKSEVNYLDWNYSQGPNNLAEFQKEGTDFAILGRGVQPVTYWWYLWKDYRQFLKYKDIPFDYIESSFYGLTYKELRDFTVAEFYKPWQAFDYSYLVFKIPPLPRNLGKKIASFSFDSFSNQWQVRGTFGFTPPEMRWTTSQGRNKPGALVISKGGGETSARLSSEVIKVKPNQVYTVRGWIINETENNLNQDKIDGFLRLDVYWDNQLLNFDRLGNRVAVSCRAPVNNQWNLVQVSIKTSSEKDQFLSVSFQVKENDRRYYSFVDDIEVFEGDSDIIEKYPEIPYIKSTIPLDSLYKSQFL